MLLNCDIEEDSWESLGLQGDQTLNIHWNDILKLKHRYFGHLRTRTDSLDKTLRLGKIEGRRRGWQRMRSLNGITDSMDTSLSKLQVRVKDMETAMAPHSSTLAWKIPLTEEPGALQSVWSLRVRHDWATWLSLFTFMHWRRKWQPTPVFLPGESQGGGAWWTAVYGVTYNLTRLKWLCSSRSTSEGQGGMAFCSPRGHKEWATEQQQQSFKHIFKVVKCQHQ